MNDRDTMPKIKGMPQDQIDAILAKRVNAKVDLTPRVKRPRPDFEEQMKNYNFGDENEMPDIEISIEELERLRDGK